MARESDQNRGVRHADEATAAATLRLIAEYSSDVIARVTPGFVFSYVSPSAERIFRRPVAESIGHHISEFVLPEDMPVIMEASRRVLSGETADAVVTVRAIRGDGTLVWVEVASRMIGQNVAGRAGDRAVVMRDVSERKMLEDELKAAAMKDGLTGLANRRAFDEALQEGWQRTVRERDCMSLLLIDVDHFKAYNDTHGHQSGDDCLRRVADALTGVARRRADLVARYGGEEIAIILRGSDAAGAALVAERSLAAVRGLAIASAPCIGPVTISVGAATASATAMTSWPETMPHALLAAADRALYAAKAAGRNCSMAAPGIAP